MEALLCAPLSLHSNPQAGIKINGGKTSKSRRGVSEKGKLCASTAVGRRGVTVSAGVHGETSFGSRQLLAGGKFAGLRKCSGVHEFAKSDNSRVVRRVWSQSPKQRHTHTIQVSVRAGLSSVPDSNLGLYDPAFDRDGCGVGFVTKLSQQPSRDIVSLSCPLLIAIILLISPWRLAHSLHCLALLETCTEPDHDIIEGSL